MHSVVAIAMCTFVCEVLEALQSNQKCLARALTDVLRLDVAYIIVSQCDIGLELPHMLSVVGLSAGGYGNDLVPLLIGAKSVAKTPWVPCTGVFEKLGYVVCMTELESFHNNLSVTIAEFETKGGTGSESEGHPLLFQHPCVHVP